jgi:hypothetical protein
MSALRVVQGVCASTPGATNRQVLMSVYDVAMVIGRCVTFCVSRSIILAPWSGVRTCGSARQYITFISYVLPPNAPFRIFDIHLHQSLPTSHCASSQSRLDRPRGNFRHPGDLTRTVYFDHGKGSFHRFYLQAGSLLLLLCY